MPELPEVETVRRGLEARVLGRRIDAVDLRRRDLRIPFPEGFAARLKGRRIQRIGRRAKYLLAHLDDGGVLIIHLGMAGRLMLSDGPAAVPPGKHAHVEFVFEGGGRVVYEDHRRFGLMTLAEEAELAAHPLLAHLGLEPLAPEFNGAALAQLFAGRRTPVKAALLDQTAVVGVGNIYACEAMYRARISPRRLAKTVSGERADRLAAAVRAVLEEAIAAGGSSLRDYVQASGELGYFQHAWRVYDRAGQKCRTRGCTGTVRRQVQSNRSTFYCPSCPR
jgi:formamidopyrimidine-DNA glycosylase